MPAFPPRTPGSAPLIVNSNAPAPGEGTCGTCKFTQLMPQDVSQVICGGVPPSPIGTPTGIVWARPAMARSERACGLFQPKPPVLAS